MRDAISNGWENFKSIRNVSEAAQKILKEK